MRPATVGGLRRRHAAAAVAVALFLIALALLYPGVLTGSAVGDDASTLGIWPMTELGRSPPADSNPYLFDATYVFRPDLQWARSRVHDLRPPLWNPFHSAGFPQLASQQTAPLYPLTLLTYVLPFWWSLGFVMALKLVLAGLGTFLFARTIGLTRWPALFGAVAFAFGVFFISWLSHPHTSVYCLLPWLLLAVEGVLRRGRRRDAALLAAVWTMALLGGHPESAFISGLLLAGWAIWRLTDSRVHRRRAGILLAGGLALGTAAAAVVLLPFIEALDQSYDTGRGSERGLEPRYALSLLVPEAWGRPDRAYHDIASSNYLERTVYVGAMSLLLAVTAVLCWSRPAVRFFAIAALVASVFAFEVPVVTGLLLSLPIVDEAAMARACIVLSFCLAILGGFGLQSLAERDPRARRVAPVVAAFALGAPAILLLANGDVRGELSELSAILPLLGGQPANAAEAQAASIVRWLVFGLCASAVLLFAARRQPAAAVVGVVAVALVTVDLVNLNRGFYPTFDPALIEGVPASVGFASQHVRSGRIASERNTFLPNQSARYALRDVRGQGLPEVRRVGRLYVGLGGTGGHAKRVEYTPDFAKLLRVFGVTELLGSPPPTEGITPHPDAVGLPVFQVDALPRAFVATSWRAVPDEDSALRDTLASSPEELDAQPVIEGAPENTAGGTPAPSTPARFVVDGDLKVQLSVDAPQGGWLVLLDTYYPGWSANVDGRDAEIHPANGAFRAVRLPPGASSVTFSYRPLSIIGGVVISILAGLGIVALLVIRPRRSGRPNMADRDG